MSLRDKIINWADKYHLTNSLTRKFRDLYNSNEIVKQLADQSLHFFGGAVAVYALATLTGNLWLGIIPVAGAWTYHEIKQGASSRPWDKPLDITFQVLGLWYGAHLFI